MTNLLEETMKDIESSGHTVADIVFIGSKNGEYRCSWEQFQALANVEYDAGYGAAQVALDLIIVFCDGQKMWRAEYDGSEWWEYSTPFFMPNESKPMNKLFASRVGWESAGEINGEED